MKRFLAVCHLEDAQALRSARRSCASCPSRLALPCRPAFGPSSSAACRKSPLRDINARVRCRQLWKRFSLLQSLPLSPVPITAHSELPSCTVCDTFMSGREIFFCWWERQKEHSSCARTLGARVGRLAVPTSTGTRCTRWPMTAVVANIAYGLQPRVTGARCCVPATISGRAGLTHRRPDSISRRYRSFSEKHLADLAWPPG